MLCFDMRARTDLVSVTLEHCLHLCIPDLHKDALNKVYVGHVKWLLLQEKRFSLYKVQEKFRNKGKFWVMGQGDGPPELPKGENFIG